MFGGASVKGDPIFRRESFKQKENVGRSNHPDSSLTLSFAK